MIRHLIRHGDKFALICVGSVLYGRQARYKGEKMCGCIKSVMRFFKVCSYRAIILEFLYLN